MTWRTLNSLGSGRRSGVGVALRRVSSVSSVRLVVSIYDDLAAELGWAGGHRVTALLGEDGHAGRLRLKISDTVGVKLQGNSLSGRLVAILPPTATLPADTKPVTPCPWSRIDAEDPGAGIEIMLPEWAGRPPQRFDDHPRAVKDKRL